MCKFIKMDYPAEQFRTTWTDVSKIRLSSDWRTDYTKNHEKFRKSASIPRRKIEHVATVNFQKRLLTVFALTHAQDGSSFRQLLLTLGGNRTSRTAGVSNEFNIAAGFVYSRWRSIVTDGGVDRTLHTGLSRTHFTLFSHRMAQGITGVLAQTKPSLPIHMSSMFDERSPTFPRFHSPHLLTSTYFLPTTTSMSSSSDNPCDGHTKWGTLWPTGHKNTCTGYELNGLDDMEVAHNFSIF